MSHSDVEGSDMAENAPETVAKHPAWGRLDDQLKWYDTKSANYQKMYKCLKIGQFTLAALIPVIAHADWHFAKWAISILGALIAILEAVQHVYQYSTLWVTYRATAERLKHEKYLFLSQAGPFRDIEERERLVCLAERVEEFISVEHARWFKETKRAVVQQQKGSG